MQMVFCACSCSHAKEDAFCNKGPAYNAYIIHGKYIELNALCICCICSQSHSKSCADRLTCAADHTTCKHGLHASCDCGRLPHRLQLPCQGHTAAAPHDHHSCLSKRLCSHPGQRDWSRLPEHAQKLSDKGACHSSPSFPSSSRSGCGQCLASGMQRLLTTGPNVPLTTLSSGNIDWCDCVWHLCSCAKLKHLHIEVLQLARQSV